MPEDFNQPTGEFKPNIYPIMYWALAFGAIAGIVLFLIFLLSQYLTYVWVPVFLAGMVWGSYRNYKKQKEEWAQNSGLPLTPQSPITEFKQAAQDIIGASREMMAERRAEDAYQEQMEQQAAMEMEEQPMEEMVTEEESPQYTQQLEDENIRQNGDPEIPTPSQDLPPNVPRQNFSNPEDNQPPQPPRI